MYSPTSGTLWGFNVAAASTANFWENMAIGPYSATSGAYGLGLRVGTLRVYHSNSPDGTWSNFAGVARRNTSGAQSDEISAHDAGMVPYMSSSPPQGRQPNGLWGYRSICDKGDHATAGAHTGSKDADILAFANRIYQPYGSGGQFNWGAPVDPNAPGGQYGGTRSTWALWAGCPHEPDSAPSNVFGFNDDGTDPGVGVIAQRYIAAQEHIFDIVEARRIALGQPLRLYFFHIITGVWDGSYMMPTAYRHGRGIDQYYPAVAANPPVHYTVSNFRNSFWDYPKFQNWLSAARAIDGPNVALAFGEWAHGDIYTAGDSTGTIIPHYSGDFIRNNANTLLTMKVADGGPLIWTFPWFQSTGHKIDPSKPQNFTAFHDGAITLSGAVSTGGGGGPPPPPPPPPPTVPPPAPTSFNVTDITTSTARINMLNALPTGAFGWNVYEDNSAAHLTNSQSTNISLPSNLTYWPISSGTTSDFWEVTVIGAGNLESPRSAHITVPFVSTADTTPPPVPAAPGAFGPILYVDPNGVTLAYVVISWPPSSATDIGTYAVYVNGVLYGDRVSAGITSITVWAMTPGATVLFTMDAADTSGNKSAQSASTSVTMPTVVDVTPPTFTTADHGLGQTLITPGGFTLACNPAFDSESGVQYYEWLLSANYQVTTARTATNLYTVSGLQGNLTGTAQVRALDGKLNASAWSTPPLTVYTGSLTVPRPIASCVATPSTAVAPADVVFNASGSSGGTGALTFWFDPDDGNVIPSFPVLFAADGSRLATVASSGVSTSTFQAHYATARTARPRLVAVDSANQWDMVQITVQIGYPVGGGTGGGGGGGGGGFATTHGWKYPLAGSPMSAQWMKETLDQIDYAVSNVEAAIGDLTAAFLAGSGTGSVSGGGGYVSGYVYGTTIPPTLTPTRLALSWVKLDVGGTGVVTPTMLGISWVDLEVTV